VALCSKFFDYHALDPGSVPAYEIGDRVDVFWVAIQTLKDPATGTSNESCDTACLLNGSIKTALCMILSFRGKLFLTEDKQFHDNFF
jgi:hypothetical protein